MQDNEKISNLMDRSNDLSTAGKYGEAVKLALQAWPLIEEKSRENGFYIWVIESLINDYFRGGNYDEAKKWASELIANKDPSEMPSGDYFWMGKIEFEKNNLDDAFAWFEKAYQEDDLVFKGESKKYLDFHSKRKTNRA